MTVVVLAACKQTDPPLPKQAEGAEHIACAVGGAREFSDACAVERGTRDGTLFLTVRHPDGAFRRFEVLKDGRGVATADGAKPAQVSMADGRIEVTVEDDRYRFPVTVRPAAQASNDAAQP